MLSEITIIYYIYIYLLLENPEKFINRIDNYVNIATCRSGFIQVIL